MERRLLSGAMEVRNTETGKRQIKGQCMQCGEQSIIEIIDTSFPPIIGITYCEGSFRCLDKALSQVEQLNERFKVREFIRLLTTP